MAMERTLILVKPDGMQRRLAGQLIARLENKGLRLVGLKLMKITPELAKEHYAEHVEKPFYPGLEEFITSSPVVAICAEGPEAISTVRTMLGSTNGRKAAPGTIRGDYSISRQYNLMHGSDGPEAARREIGIYFQPDELFDYETTLGGWVCADDER